MHPTSFHVHCMISPDYLILLNVFQEIECATVFSIVKIGATKAMKIAVSIEHFEKLQLIVCFINYEKSIHKPLNTTDYVCFARML